MSTTTQKINEKTAINKQKINYETNTTSSKLQHPPDRNIISNLNKTKSINRKLSTGSSDAGRNRCFCFSNYKRQQFCLNLLYYKSYSLCYIIIIMVMLASFIYDLSDLKIDNTSLSDQPEWFIALNIGCLGLMLLDLLIHIQAFLSAFWKSWVNILDFTFVIICSGITPIYWFVPAWILQFLLLSRFLLRLFRRHTFRKEYVSARNTLIDFTSYEENIDEQRKYTEFSDDNVV